MTRIADGPACLASFHARAALMGFAFTVICWSGGSPVTPELYGPSVYAIPAVAWGMTQTALGALCALFLVTGWVVPLAATSFLSMLYYAALGSMAIRAPQGTLVAVGAVTMMVVPCVSTFLYATRMAGRGR